MRSCSKGLSSAELFRTKIFPIERAEVDGDSRSPGGENQASFRVMDFFSSEGRKLHQNLSLTFCTEERERSYAIKNASDLHGHHTRKYSTATMTGHSKKRDRVKRLERDIKIVGGQVDSYSAVKARLLRQQKIL